ncbi:MAG: NAD(P)/FAD-dependent oxidoreductase [Acidobacteriota bacterium]|jgi:thioredoxin reductase (NADPH)|nr:NAD(P)/FAD-dependent oxidoreductase [Acidobacteriota bacterium]
MNKKDFDVIIIGGGAAGISAALWCDELGLNAILLESASELGGQLLWTYNAIENYLGVKTENGQQMRDIFVEQIGDRNFTLKLNSKVQKIDLENKIVELQNGEELQAKFVIIATGVKRRKLNIEGEKQFQGKGIIKSGKRDGELVKNKTVAVIGGGDAAFENALILSKFASKVFLIHRSKNFKARSEFLTEVKDNPKIEIITNTIVGKIIGDECIKNIELKNTQEKEIYNLPTNFILFRIGVEPNTNIFRGKIELDERGYIEIDNQCKTSVENVYAIGDVANPLSPTISTAVGMGANAVKIILAKSD